MVKDNDMTMIGKGSYWMGNIVVNRYPKLANYCAGRLFV